MFLFNIIVFGFKKPKLKNTNVWSKGGLQQNGVFYEHVLCKLWKVIVFLGPFFGKLWLMFQKHYKIMYFSTFLKAKKREKITIFQSQQLVQVKVSNWSKLEVPKKGQLGPVTDFENLRAHFLNFKKCVETPIFIVFFWQALFWKKNKLGPVTDFEKGQTWTSYWLHSYIYIIYIYIYVCVCLFFLGGGGI